MDIHSNNLYDINLDDPAVYEELDETITVNEIASCIDKLKRDKSHGNDHILNEIFIECTNYLVPTLHKMFNMVLNTDIFPTSWSSAVIIPIF